MSIRDNVIATAKSQVGYHEGYSNGHWDNIEKYAAQVPGLAWANGQPWCAVFVSYCFNAAGVLNLIPGGATASVAHLRDAAKQAGQFSEVPSVGAIVIYGANGDAHTGIVVAFDATTITTVEGNTNTTGSAEGDGVYLKTHNRTDPWVYGYSHPNFPKEAPVTTTTRGVNIDAAIASIRKAIVNNAGHPIKLAKLRTALAALLSIHPK